MNLEVLIDEEKLSKRVEEIANQIEMDYQNEDIVLLCILKGSIFFFTDLAKKINKDVFLDFIQVSSYEGTKSSGKINLRLDVRDSLERKNVIIVEDIIDTGRTLKYLLDHIKSLNPKSIKLCTLLDKPEKRIEDIKVDYVGFQIPDEFIVGYGLDCDEKYRNLPYIGCLK